MLAKLNNRLAIGKHSPSDTAFGGIDVLFAGDFAQFPPVSDYPLYYGSSQDTPLKPSKGQSQNDRELGRSLWHQLTHVIILDEQMRVTDKGYQELLERVAIGKGTQNDYQFLQTRIVEILDIHDTQFQEAPMITPGNILVNASNRMHATSEAQSCGYQLLLRYPTDTCSKIKICKSKAKQLRSIPLSKTANLPAECYLFPGMPVKLTENIAVKFGLTNSTSGVIKEIVCDPREKCSQEQIHILQYNTLYVIVTFETTECLQLEGLFQKDIPIYPTTKSFSYKFPGTKKRSSISRTQLPLVPAYSYTAYKSQAQTLPCAIVDLVPAPHMNVTDSSFA